MTDYIIAPNKVPPISSEKNDIESKFQNILFQIKPSNNYLSKIREIFLNADDKSKKLIISILEDYSVLIKTKSEEEILTIIIKIIHFKKNVTFIIF